MLTQTSWLSFRLNLPMASNKSGAAFKFKPLAWDLRLDVPNANEL
jgi:hypothetical protein